MLILVSLESQSLYSEAILRLPKIHDVACSLGSQTGAAVGQEIGEDLHAFMFQGINGVHQQAEM